ncbi:MAG: 2Fe-2S iron-sulfur cluster-binding protein [Saprospiraceae bacterium]
MARVTIDDITIEVPDGTTILNAARMIGGDIVPPAMCYYSSLKTSGGYCRTCIVKVEQGSEKDPRPMPKPVASCRTTVMDGMVVRNITSPEILETRAGVVEFLLANHPLDCPVCDQAGECHLQDLGYQHGKAGTRYEFPRREFEKIDIGDKIQLHMTRCILCYRCVKVAEQLTPTRVHGVMNRGDVGEISTYIENVIDNEMSGNMIDVCPVGALTDKTFRFKSRVWFTKPVDAHRDCPSCNGKVRLWYKGEEVLRVTGRKDEYGEIIKNEDGSTAWVCNSCRFDHKKTSDWVIEGPSKVQRDSVIGANHYLQEVKFETQLAQKFLEVGKRQELGDGFLNPNNV